jgi:thiol-disulfide isomerase/thioredoxin
MARTAAFGLILSMVFVVIACRGTNDRNGRTDEGKARGVSTAVFSVEPIDATGLTKLIAERNGKVLLMNIWATWCAPCVAEFPDLVKLSQTYDTTGVEVVAISADYPDEVDTKIIPFLRKMNVPFRVFVAQFKHQEDFINAVNRSWSGALPATLVYDSHGKEHWFHVGQQSYEDFKNQIDKVKGGL